MIKDEMLRTVLSLSITLLLFSLIGLVYAEKGSGEFVISVLSTAINIVMVLGVIIVLHIKKALNEKN